MNDQNSEFIEAELKDGGVPLVVKLLLFVCVSLIVALIVLEIQLQRRNQAIDSLEGTVARVEKSVLVIETDTRRIAKIADEVSEGDPEQAAALQELFRKIDAIYQATVVEAKAAG